MAKSIRQQIADNEAKIAALQVVIAGLQGKLGEEVDEDAVQANTEITFEYGKGEGKRVLQGFVLGRKDPEPGTKNATQVKVAVGTGFEAQTLVIYLAAVKSIVQPVAEEAQQAEQDPAA